MVLLVIGVLFSFISIVAIIATSDDNYSGGHVVIWLAASLGGLLIQSGLMEIDHRPTALDVYRGNTTLEITYKDSIAIDSTVVFK